MAQDRVEEIAALLVQAGNAHHQYEVTALKSVYDQDWPRWYAGYAVEQGISALLGHVVTVDQLTQFFIANYGEFQRLNTGEAWADFTARRLQTQL